MDKMKHEKLHSGGIRNAAKLLAAAGIFLLLSALHSPAAKADSLNGVTLTGAGSTGGFFFAPGTSAGDLSLMVTGCPGSQLTGGCLLDAGIVGSTTIGGAAFTWQILPVSADFTPCAGTSGCWDFGSITTGTSDWLISNNANQLGPGGQGGGLITWSSITEVGGVDTLLGTATGTDPSGATVDDSFSVTLGALSCTDASGTPTTPCSLSAIAASDPTYGTASLSSGQFGSTTPPSPTPEPATLVLFGTGLLGLMAFGRRRALAGKGHGSTSSC